MTVTADPPEAPRVTDQTAQPGQPDQRDRSAPKSADQPEPRFLRQDKGSRELEADESYDPDEETVFSGWRTIQTWEIALFLVTFIAALLIWNIFIFVHGGFSNLRLPFG